MVKSIKLIILGFILVNLDFNLKAQVSVDVLVVGAGGAGGGHSNTSTSFGIGGGGGGEVVFVTGHLLSIGSYDAIVASTTTGTMSGAGPNGGSSQFKNSGSLIITALGGGGGGGSGFGPGRDGGSGGGGHASSGGLGVTSSSTGVNGSILNYANNGGNPGTGTGGGGGGASTAGSGTSGGQGVSISISGTAIIYGSGGGGNSRNGTGGNGGTNAGNGSSGNTSSRTGLDAVSNRGGGGGGNIGGNTSRSGSGGSGVVIIRYASNVRLCTGGDTSSYTGNGTNGTNGVRYQVHTFRSNGTFTYTGIITTQPSTSSQSVCVNGTSSALTVAATGTTKTYKWYSNVNNSNSGGSLITGATSDIYTPPTNFAGTRYYYCEVTSTTNSVTTVQTSNVSGAINVGTVAGTISGANTVNSGTNSTTLTLSGHTGTIQWQSSTNGTTFGTATGTSTNTTYTATNLTATTYYRAVVTNGSCGSLTTASATILVLPSTTPSATSMSITGTNTTNSMSRNTATVVDGGLTITGSGNISGFTVSISENYSSGDLLGYTGTLPTGVTTSGFSTTSRSIVFRGNATAAQWQAFLRTVTLTSTAGTCNPEKRKVTFTVSTNFYNYFNGHYYEYVSAGRIWSSAKSNAESKTFFGRQGYLATISSAEENAYISKLIGQNSWLGATDNYLEINKAVGYTKYTSQSQAEGKYHWVSGPEKGVQVSNGTSSVSGRYLRWAGGEPNNYNTGFKDKSLNLYGEHYLHIYSSSSTWNDFPDDRSLGSIIEYGDMPGDNPVTGIDFTRDIIISGLTSGSISGGLGTVCSGTNTTTLTLTGASGSVSRWESSDDNFLSNVQTISNTTTSLNAANLTEKTFYRAVMVNGSCTLPTPSTYINVLELSGGVISSESNEGCAGSAINLTLGGHKGTVSKWQISSSSNGSSPTDIASTSTSLSHTISSAGTYYISAVVGNSSCSNSENSEWYPVEIASAGAPTAGEVSSAAHCGSANNGTLTLKGSKGGSSYLWQKSTDGGSTWSNAGSTTTRLTYNNISQNTQYRVQVSKGSCGSANSSVGEIIIYGTTISQWTGEGSNDNWSTAANWCGEVVGTTGRRVAISEDAQRDPVLDGNISLAELNFNASGKKITLGIWNAEIQSILGADSLNYFKTTDTGSLIKTIAHSDSFTFAVGLANYNPVTIINNTGTADQFSVYVFDEVYANGRKGSGNAMTNKARIQSTWEIGKANANAGSGVDFVFEWEGSKRKGGTITNPSVNHYNKNTRDWEFASNSSISRGTNSLRLKGYTGTFSPFAIGDGMTPLPVDIISFTAEGKANTVQLSWITESEINHSHFVVMRSKDGKEWEEIGVVTNKSNSQGLNQYELIDTKPYTDNYYQLKIVDKEGNSELSDIRFVQLSIAKPLFVLSPNPTSGVVKIQTESQDADYSVYDISGKVLHQGTLNKEIELNNLSSGIYFIKVMVEDRVEVKKLIVE